MTFLLFILTLLVFSCDSSGNGSYEYEINYCEESDVYSNINGITITDDEGNINQYNAQNDDWQCCIIEDTIGLLSSNSSSESDVIPYLISINAAYPNPNASTFSFDYTLNEHLNISIFVIDESGEQIDSIMESEPISTGNHESEWNPDSSILSGLYRVILHVENSDNISCYGNICLCVEDQNCNEVCGY